MFDCFSLMKYSTFLLVIVIAILSCAGFAQEPKSSPSPQEQPAKPPEEEKVYSSKEVDTKAVIKNRDSIDPGTSMGYSRDCPDGVVLVLKVVLYKTGKVTNIQIVKPINCSFEEKAIKNVRKVKFTPAIKDGVAVSQYQTFQFNFHKF